MADTRKEFARQRSCPGGAGRQAAACRHWSRLRSVGDARAKWPHRHRRVPVGIYAEQALKKLHLLDAMSPRLARTEDVRAALLLAERGVVPAAIVYATDAAVSKAVMIAGTFPADTHDPVLIRLPSSNPQTRQRHVR